jgi:hypothetical protein
MAGGVVNARELLREARQRHGIRFILEAGPRVILEPGPPSGFLVSSPPQPPADVISQLREHREEIVAWLRVEGKMSAAQDRVRTLIDEAPHPRPEWEFDDVMPMSVISGRFHNAGDIDLAHSCIERFETGWEALIAGASRDEVEAIVLGGVA